MLGTSCSSPSNVRNLCAHWTVAYLSIVVLSCSQTSLPGRQQEGWVRDDGQCQQEWQAKHVWLAALAIYCLADLSIKLRCAALTDRPNLALSKLKSERMRTVLLVVVSDTLQLVQAQRTHAPRVHARGTEGALLG
jgi:hypothetical protein